MSLALALLLSAGVAIAQERIAGNGDVKKEVRDVTGFSGIAVGGSAHVYLVQGNTESVQIEAESNLLPYIIADIDHHNLSIHFKRGYNLKNTKPINIYVTAKDIDFIGASGGVKLDAIQGIKTDKIRLEASGSLSINMKLDAKALDASFSGSVEAKIEGTVEEAEYAISGSANVSAPGLQTSSVNINISGSGDLDLAVVKDLNVSISGSGRIHYKGSPSITKHISGSGRIYND
ncbi:Putative auto-transporter adhesin, head GIN domain [Chitinophaga costaii]|uniref:Putative auto-transporter adhesin, head GIN domain n=2 Tax=Chitinophaga costaii TaxID=1335309 RepID=A0A1C4E554_9BACT|nr:Putative auto-transporter adhesin, head GIN domain [Chitinophaga costaii]